MAWGVVSKSANSTLASTEVNQLQENFTALATGASGAPAIAVNSFMVTGVASLASLTVTGAATVNGTATLNSHLIVASSLLYANQSTSRVGIGTSSPTNTLEVRKDTAGAVAVAVVSNKSTDASATSCQVNFDLADTSGNAVNAATIRAGKEQVWTSTASTQDSFLSFFTTLNGSSGEVARITSAGKFATGGEDAPDCDTGGLTLNHGSNDGFAMTLKSSDVAHGMTAVAETDTYAAFGKADSNAGGLLIESFSEGSIATWMQAIATTEDTTDTSTSTGCIRLAGVKKSGTGAGALGATANVLAVNNEGTTVFLIKGNGDVHATNTSLTALDDEDDLALADAAKWMMTPMKKEKELLGGKAYEVLRREGVFHGPDDAFVSMQGMMRVQMGALGQLFKGLAFLAQSHGVTVDDLKKAMVG